MEFLFSLTLGHVKQDGPGQQGIIFRPVGVQQWNAALPPRSFERNPAIRSTRGIPASVELSVKFHYAEE